MSLICVVQIHKYITLKYKLYNLIQYNSTAFVTSGVLDLLKVLSLDQ